MRFIKAFKSRRVPLSDPAYDLVIRNGTVGTASDVFAADVAII